MIYLQISTFNKPIQLVFEHPLHSTIWALNNLIPHVLEGHSCETSSLNCFEEAILEDSCKTKSKYFKYAFFTIHLTITAFVLMMILKISRMSKEKQKLKQ
jgi:hypothetical protein